MELDPITRMMIAAKQQILLYQATHKEKRLCDKPSKDTKDDTPDITKFCMETIDIVVNNGDGTYTVVCGNCGTPHHHRGIINLFERDKCCK